MSKPTRIGAVLHRVSADKYASMTMQAERLAQANLRLGRIEAEERRKKAAAEAWTRAQILRLDRPEYLTLRGAQWKDKLYRRAIRRDEWQAFQDRKLLERQAERETKKEEWQAFICADEQVEIDVTNLPKF